MTLEPPDYRNLELILKPGHPRTLEFLEIWVQWGLLNHGQVRQFAALYLSETIPNPGLRLPLRINSHQNRLLDGLELGLDWGLLSWEQSNLGLASALPSPKPSPPRQKSKSDRSPSTPKPVSPLGQFWLAFKDELSVQWLLFLGIFLVLLSSGVLAASQWQNFPPVGQYLLLFVYTGVFWWGYGWCRLQDNLKLTGRTLEKLVFLLIPINFWAMDGLGLARSPGGLGIMAVAGGALAAMVWARHQLKSPAIPPYFLGNFLLLAVLHWGWNLSEHWATVGLYGGVGATVAIVRFVAPRSQKTKGLGDRLGTFFVVVALGILLVRSVFVELSALPELSLAIALLGWLWADLALEQRLTPQPLKNPAREPGTPEDRDRQTQSLTLFSRTMGNGGQALGAMVMALAWLMAFFNWRWFEWDRGFLSPMLGQVIAIVVLGLIFLGQRLRRCRWWGDFLALYGLGLVLLLLVQGLIPSEWRTQALGTALAVSQSGRTPWAIYGVTLIPYLWGMMAVGFWLWHQGRSPEGQFADRCNLWFALGLLGLAVANPTWRSLHLLAMVGTLVWLTRRDFPRYGWGVWAANLYGAGAVISLIVGIWPSPLMAGDGLTRIFHWAMVLEGVALAQGLWSWYLDPHGRWESSLGITTGDGFWDLAAPQMTKPPGNGSMVLSPLLRRHHRDWAWFMGAGWAIASFLLWAWGVYLTLDRGLPVMSGVLWWAWVPVMLTLGAGSYGKKYSPYFTMASGGAVVGLALLTLGSPALRPVGWAIATLLMMPNVFYGRQRWGAVLHWGLALGTGGWVMVNYGIGAWGLLWGALLLGGLVVAHGVLIRSPWGLAQLYGAGLTPWQYVLEGGLLWGFMGQYGQNNALLGPGHGEVIAAAAIAVGMGWRALASGGEKVPTAGPIFSRRAWLQILGAVAFTTAACEMLAGVNYGGGKWFAIALLHLLLALGLAGTHPQLWWYGRYSPALQRRLTSWIPRGWVWQWLPLLLAGGAFYWRWPGFFFGPTSGLVFWAIALVLWSYGPIHSVFTYGALASITLGSYELVIYQLAQRSGGGSVHDLFTILAMVPLVMAIVFRSGALVARNKTWFQSLSAKAVIRSAHGHWVGAWCLRLAMVIFLREETIAWPRGVILLNGLLVLYAVLQGRDPEETQSPFWSDFWVYLGFGEMLITGFYGHLLYDFSAWAPWRGLGLALGAVILGLLPWRAWGWRSQPWQRISLFFPVISVVLLGAGFNGWSLLAIAGFYGHTAWKERKFAWSYITLILVNWALLRFFNQVSGLDPLILVGCWSLSLLYVAQGEPAMQGRSHRHTRHWFRQIAAGLFCGVALVVHQGTLGLVPGAISLGVLLAGLGLRLRAFLYVGTIAFLLNGTYQLVLLIQLYGFLKWVIGSVVGLVLIFLGGYFEQSKQKLLEVIRDYLAALEEWQ